MDLLFPSPNWFYTYDVALEFVFALVAFYVSYVAFSIFRKTSQRYVLYFGIGFGTISFSYFVQSILNMFILYHLGSEESFVSMILSVQAINILSLLAHIFFFTVGLSFLLFITFKEKRLRLLWFLLLVPLSVIFMSQNMIYMFYLISSIYLFFISYHYISIFVSRKSLGQLLVALAFLFLFLGHFHFLISVNHHFFYVVGKVLELFSYCFIVGNFYMVYRK